MSTTRCKHGVVVETTTDSFTCYACEPKAAAEEMDRLRERIKELEGNGLPNIEERPEFAKADDETSLQALRRWVEAEEPDTIMRSVSEGGDVFEFDPLSVVAFMRENEGLRAVIRVLRLHGEAYLTLKDMGPLHEWRQRLITLLKETERLT